MGTSDRQIRAADETADQSYLSSNSGIIDVCKVLSFLIDSFLNIEWTPSKKPIGKMP